MESRWKNEIPRAKSSPIPQENPIISDVETIMPSRRSNTSPLRCPSGKRSFAVFFFRPCPVKSARVKSAMSCGVVQIAPGTLETVFALILRFSDRTQAISGFPSPVSAIESGRKTYSSSNAESGLPAQCSSVKTARHSAV